MLGMGMWVYPAWSDPGRCFGLLAVQTYRKPVRPRTYCVRTVAIVQVVRERMNNMSVHKVPSQALRLLLLAFVSHAD